MACLKKDEKSDYNKALIGDDIVDFVNQKLRNGGEYYTPRPLIKTIIKIVAPEIGNRVYDGATGSVGFLVEAFSYLQGKAKAIKEQAVLQQDIFYGKEKKALAYIIGIMDMILHGIEAPEILHTNTFSENIKDM